MMYFRRQESSVKGNLRFIYTLLPASRTYRAWQVGGPLVNHSGPVDRLVG